MYGHTKLENYSATEYFTNMVENVETTAMECQCVCSCFVLQNFIAVMGLEMLLMCCFLLKRILWVGLDVRTNVVSMCAILTVLRSFSK